MADLTELTAEVASNSDVVDSAVVTLNELAAMLEDAQNDPAAIAALAADLRSNSADLAAAIASTDPTPPAEEPPVEPPA